LLSLFDKNNENFQAKPKISEEYVDYDKSQELEADVSSLGASATNSILSLIKEGNKNLSDIISLIGNEELAKKYIEKLNLLFLSKSQLNPKAAKIAKLKSKRKIILQQAPEAEIKKSKEKGLKNQKKDF